MNEMQKKAKKADQIFYGILASAMILVGIFMLVQHQYEKAQSEYRVCVLVNGYNSPVCE